jgi:hypothetical protein
MRAEAEKWDRENGKSLAHHVVEDGQLIPVNRPCDWCGRKVKRGFIHNGCQKEESALYADIFYG